ncbi:MAG TPA: DUF4835 family protein [Bacteroidota bacterium]|jgi:hypothetical protein
MATSRTGLFFVLLSLLFSAQSRLESQELDCEIKYTNTEALPAAARENLSDFLPELNQYVNSYRWTKEDMGNLKIKCTIEFAFQGSPRSNHYVVQAFIGSQRPIFRLDRNTTVVRIIDGNWEFDYVRNQPLIHNETKFDPLLSVIDFYMYMIVGYDFETYKAGDGSPYFQKAMDIANIARAGRGATGWDNPSPNVYSRGEFIDELMNARFSDFREAFYRYYYRGLDLLSKDEGRARKNMFAALEKIGKVQQKINSRTLIIKAFFDTQYGEIKNDFLKDPDPDIYAKLKQIDPAHQTEYDEGAKDPRRAGAR